ncbi:MAG TPA: hypothetical protein VNQ90_05660 [Chthoniobacteraceae bacterium]|nr:hypothetical protein [Chthoniobacteraceae bacterium]
MASDNLALHKPYRLIPEPSYAPTTDSGDSVDLTDGLRASPADGTDRLWTSTACVGWRASRPVLVVVDLGAVHPLGGFAVSTTGGESSVTPPEYVGVLVSDDGEQWYDAGALSAKSESQPPRVFPGSIGERAYRFSYSSRKYRTHGRYVAFVLQVRNNPFIICDEVEVYRGDAGGLEESRGPVVASRMEDVDAYMEKCLTRVGIEERIRQDEERLRRQIEASSLIRARKEELLAAFPSEGTWQLPDVASPRQFRTVLPYEGTHRQMMAIQGRFWAALGVPRLFVEKDHRFAYLEWGRLPRPLENAEMNVTLLQQEVRGDSVTLGNASGNPLPLSVRLIPKPGERLPAEGAFSATPVIWTDTAQSIPMADALPGDNRVTAGREAVKMSLPAGTVVKWWFSVDAGGLEPGSYALEMEVVFEERTLRIPCQVTVKAPKAQPSRLLLGLWDYLDTNGYCALTRENRAEALRLMRSMGVNYPAGSRSLLPLPEAKDFDRENRFIGQFDAAGLKEWMKEIWPDAPRYLIFLHSRPSFTGVQHGTTAFAERVASWFKAVEAAVRDLGEDPESIDLLLVDEIRTREGNELTLHWAQPIRQATSFGVLMDPNWVKPHEAPVQEVFREATTLMPLVSHYIRSGKGSDVQNFYRDLTAGSERSLGFYACAGPARIACPSRYYRLSAWLAFQRGAKVLTFWAVGDTGGYSNSWNDYLFKLIPFTPFFVEEKRLVNSVHGEAIRECSEDYELLSMLVDKITPEHPANAEFQKLRGEIEQVASKAALSTIFISKGNWFHPFPHETLDQLRLKAMDLLTSSHD